MSNSWLHKMDSLKPIPVAPYPQDRPPVMFILVVFAVCVAPVVGFVLWAWA